MFAYSENLQVYTHECTLNKISINSMDHEIFDSAHHFYIPKDMQ